MPNVLDADGLEIKTRDEIVQELSDAYRLIYGNDINLDQDTPDGQTVNIFAQSVVDTLELIQSVYTSFDPDEAVGRSLDSRVAINGIQRIGATFSRTNVTVVTSRALNLKGLDEDVEQVFTISDSEGNEAVLEESVSLPSAGTYVLSFRALNAGQVLFLPNTLTIPSTIVLGVTSVNNPTAQLLVGVDEETDAALKLRRALSIAINAVGYRESLIAALRNIPGISEAIVYENVTGVTDADGIPSHSIWVIVEGSYANVDVATAIYQQRNAGAGMRGDIVFEITQPDGTPFLIQWDNVVLYEPFIKFDATSINGIQPPDYSLIRTNLPLLYTPEIFETLNTSKLASIVNQIDPNTLVSNDGFSRTLSGTYTDLLAANVRNEKYFITSENVIIYPILVLPSVKIVDQNGTLQLSALGGFGDYAWTIQGPDLGCTIDSFTGLFSASNTSGTVTVRVTDDDAVFTEVTVEVQ